jgi:transposase
MATTDAKAEARVLFETTNQTQAEIAKAVGRSVSTISRWAARENWQRPGEKNKPPREPNFHGRRSPT